jgi:hypothetical protein
MARPARAKREKDKDGSLDRSTGGGVGIGAAVVVITDDSVVQASLGNVINAQDVTVSASDRRDLQQLTAEIAAGGVAAGVSFTHLDVTGSSRRAMAMPRSARPTRFF